MRDGEGFGCLIGQKLPPRIGGEGGSCSKLLSPSPRPWDRKRLETLGVRLAWCVPIGEIRPFGSSLVSSIFEFSGLCR